MILPRETISASKTAMKKYRCYYLNDFRDDYDALSKEDPDGEWYRVEDVEAHFAEINKALTELREAFSAVCNRRDEMAARIEELETALRPFALAALAGAEVMQQAATSIRGNPVDGTGAYIWQASCSLNVAAFKEASRVLMER